MATSDDSITIPKEYKYVLAVGAVSALQLLSMGVRAGKARRVANVPYPYAYAPKAEAERDMSKQIFNCAQRAHQNTLESYPVFATLLGVGGLHHPALAASAGAWYLVSREVYAKGYASGDPDNRHLGTKLSALGLTVLLGTSVSTLYHQFFSKSSSSTPSQ